MAIRVKQSKPPTSGSTPVVENDVVIGTWSGSVSDRPSEADSLIFKKIRDI
jgi:hypothetical protein